MTLYVVGDVHGRIDLVKRIEALIQADAQTRGRGQDVVVIYLGDFVDRGFYSRDVLDYFLTDTDFEFDRVLIRGNHDLWLSEFAKGEPVGESWLKFGGDATLMSYGVRIDLALEESERIISAQEQFIELVPSDHLDLIARMEVSFSLGDYFFCHAGVRPGISLADQIEADLLWIREPFLSSREDFGKIIVHGHTVDNRPIFRRNRIGIDTGACYTGNLTCLVLSGESVEVLSTMQPSVA